MTALACTFGVLAFGILAALALWVGRAGQPARPTPQPPADPGMSPAAPDVYAVGTHTCRCGRFYAYRSTVTVVARVDCWCGQTIEIESDDPRQDVDHA